MMKRDIFARMILAGVLFAAPRVWADDAQNQAAVQGAIDASAAAASKDNPYDALIPPGTKLESITEANGLTTVTFSGAIGWRPWNESSDSDLTELLAKALGIPPGQLAVNVMVAGPSKSPVAVQLPSLSTYPDQMRKREQEMKTPYSVPSLPVVQRVEYKGPAPVKGLAGKNIVVGGSHGWTWEKEGRWKYQRARLNTTVEDMYPMSYVNPFLIPMLENAGANVFSMRERDFQTAEVIVDNDGPQSAKSTFATTGTWNSASKGWKGPRPASLDENAEPFTLGTTVSTDASTTATAVYTPYIPHNGNYGVYASWSQSPGNSASVPITIKHAGGTTIVKVNQQVGGNTWVYLGNFEFIAAANGGKASVTISAKDALPNATGATTISADAVRFGGGLGNIAPDGLVSGKPRYAEAGRYWIQYAGGPKEKVYLRGGSGFDHFGADYGNDIVARAEWPNYIMGAPDGPNKYMDDPGLGLPVEISLAWHTDAGVDPTGTIGTLALYRAYGDDNSPNFPDGRSRMLSRDLATLMQDEIVRTAREQYSSTWARREVKDTNYGEIRRPNMPSVILELLSHQNFNDMKYGNDPRWKRDISRAVYKSIVRFVAYRNGYDPVIQPLQVTHLAVKQTGAGSATLTWKMQPDALEPTATPTGYIVYTSRDGRGFDNGWKVAEEKWSLNNLPADTNLYFRVTATNDGGESMPSGVVGMRWSAGKKPVLIVDGFDRISGPAIMEAGTARGFDRKADPGVGYTANYGLSGDQYDFDPKSEWKNDLDNPGWGASNNEWENRREKGNTFDHVIPHGEALAAAGLTFDSEMADAFNDADVQGDYALIDWIAGREKTIMPPDGITADGAPDRLKPDFQVMKKGSMDALRAFTVKGGKLMVSGAHVAEDLMAGPLADDASRDFARTVLGVSSYETFRPDAHSASPAADSDDLAKVGAIHFGTDLDQTINVEQSVYGVPSAEFFTATGGKALMAYGENGKAAAYAAGNATVFGFPLETVLPEPARQALIGRTAAGLTGVAVPETLGQPIKPYDTGR
ncbi:hypothetical protein BH09SUM1_BH09SUM1_22250 [soil metagenome]